MSNLKTILAGLSEYYGKKLTVAEAAIYQTLLSQYPAGEIQEAVNRHLVDPDRGRFFPKVADIVAKMGGARNQHPHADEAWAIALESLDEESTVVWTQQISAARTAALPVWEAGDKIGARLAFRQAYEREVANAPVMPEWTVSLGYDPARRVDAINAALSRGLIAPETAQRHLPPGSMTPDGEAIAGLLTGSNVAQIEPSPDVQKRLNEIKRILDSAPAVDRKREEQAARIAREEARRAELMAQAGLPEDADEEPDDDIDDQATA